MSVSNIEPTNEERSERINGVLNYYCLILDGNNFDGDESSITDILTDVMHFCKQGGYDFKKLIQMSQIHFESENSEDVPGDNISELLTNVAKCAALKRINTNVMKNFTKASHEKAALREQLVDCLKACKVSVDALNQIPNTDICGKFRTTYALCSYLDKIIAKTEKSKKKRG